MPKKSSSAEKKAELKAALKEFQSSFVVYKKAMKEFKSAVNDAHDQKSLVGLRKKLAA